MIHALLLLAACLQPPWTREPCGDEVCGDAFDNDCDGLVDEDDAIDAPAWYTDADGDGWGDPADVVHTCEQPGGRVADDTDCDDADGTVHPDALDTCNHADDDCDGGIDEDAPLTTWYADTDGDTFGDTLAPVSACDEPSGVVSDATDCDDTDATVHPGAAETWYDGVDADCAGDDDFDADGDGYATLPDGPDCDDANPAIHPGVLDLRDDVDNDCDGITNQIPLDAAGIRISGPRDGAVAGAATAAGDLDGDGVDDIAIGVPYDAGTGAVYVARGPVTASSALTTWRARVSGEIANGRAGSSVAVLDDTNRDGFADLLVGAPGGADALAESGAAWLFLGPLTADLTAADADLTLVGPSSGNLGACVVSAGDVDRSGLTDWLVGIPSANGGDGAVWLLFDNLHPTGSLTSPGSLGAEITTGESSNLGTGLAGVGDLDGDGYDDIALGAPRLAPDGAGAVYLFSGQGVGRGASLDVDSADTTLWQTEGNTWTGQSVAAAGDVDGDGTPDVIVGAPILDRLGSPNAGGAYLVSGSLLGADIDLSEATAVLQGTGMNDNAGTVSGAGDVDDDGYADVLVGAPYADDAWSTAGAIYLVRGPVTGVFDLAIAGGLFTGENAGDQAGVVAPGGDVDDDGVPDLLLGAPWYDASGGGENHGAVYVVPGARF